MLGVPVPGPPAARSCWLPCCGSSPRNRFLPRTRTRAPHRSRFSRLFDISKDATSDGPSKCDVSGARSQCRPASPWPGSARRTTTAATRCALDAGCEPLLNGVVPSCGSASRSGCAPRPERRTQGAAGCRACRSARARRRQRRASARPRRRVPARNAACAPTPRAFRGHHPPSICIGRCIGPPGCAAVPQPALLRPPWRLSCSAATVYPSHPCFQRGRIGRTAKPSARRSPVERRARRSLMRQPAVARSLDAQQVTTLRAATGAATNVPQQPLPALRAAFVIARLASVATACADGTCIRAAPRSASVMPPRYRRWTRRRAAPTRATTSARPSAVPPPPSGPTCRAERLQQRQCVADAGPQALGGAWRSVGDSVQRSPPPHDQTTRAP